MSGVTDFVSKAFKKVKSVATKIWDNKIIRAVIIAVAVYYTAGLASQAGWFAPAAGEGAALSTGVAEGTTFTTVAAESTAATSGIGLGAETAAVGSADALSLGGATAGSTGAAGGGVVTGAEFAGTAGAEMAAGAAVPGAAGSAGVAGSASGAVAPTLASAPAASPGIIKGAMGWMQANPIPTMMLGQGVSGAMQSYEADQAEQRRIDQDNLEFSRRGTMGYDTAGNYAGRTPGVVASEVAAPTVQTAAPAATKVVPVKRDNLAELHKQGLVNQQRA